MDFQGENEFEAPAPTVAEQLASLRASMEALQAMMEAPVSDEDIPF